MAEVQKKKEWSSPWEFLMTCRPYLTIIKRNQNLKT
jgi:hypothetical protein